MIRVRIEPGLMSHWQVPLLPPEKRFKKIKFLVQIAKPPDKVIRKGGLGEGAVPLYFFNHP